MIGRDGIEEIRFQVPERVVRFEMEHRESGADLADHVLARVRVTSPTDPSETWEVRTAPHRDPKHPIVVVLEQPDGHQSGVMDAASARAMAWALLQAAGPADDVWPGQ